MNQNADSNLLAAYLAHLLQQRQLSALTVSSYRRDLEQLQALLPDTNWHTIAPAHIRRISAQLHAQGLSPRSVARKLSSWRGFFEWLSKQKDQAPLSSNPAQGVKGPKRSKPLPKALGVDDSVHLVSARPSPALEAIPAASAACNRAMFELLYSSGLRVSELCALDFRYHSGPPASQGWIDLTEREVTVTGKGNKMRRVPIGQAALDALQDWLQQRALLAKPDEAALFVNERSNRISPRLVQLRLKTHAQQQSMPTHVHPHMLRHSFASHVLQSSGDLRAVQEMLGHSSIASTQVYTALDFQHLSQVYDVSHPRAKRK
jgi:integrase/recombinase XerC